MSLWNTREEAKFSFKMSARHSTKTAMNSIKQHATIAPGNCSKTVALSVIAIGLLLWLSPPIALIAGILFALVFGHPFAPWHREATKWLLQICVVFLGFGMDLPVVLRLGITSSLFAAATIGATLILGWWLGQKMNLNGKTTVLISAGTAICGGSAIAAVGSVISASEAEIAVSMGTIFLLNAVALYIFPPVGHLLHLGQTQFGLWAGVAIHDISSVIGAGLSYGPNALNTATAVKLSRTLWIIPITVAIAFRCSRNQRAAVKEKGISQTQKAKVVIPWFIGFFLLASMCRSYIPAVSIWGPQVSGMAQHGMILVLFLIGASLSFRAMRSVGWRTVTVGFVLWVFISVSSVCAILFLKMAG